MDDVVTHIKKSGLTIYDLIPSNSELWITDEELKFILSNALIGLSLDEMPPRTRSKVVKIAICKALGYPIPSVFKKTQPRFTGQNFDIYIQKSSNLQIWNEEISPARRYIVIQVLKDKIAKIRVINGSELVLLDKTGTLTVKYQASFIPSTITSELLSSDTDNIKNYLKLNAVISEVNSPIDIPDGDSLLSIEEIFKRLSSLVTYRIPDSGFDQDRNRGGMLHKLACEKLGYSTFKDNGQFPDIRNQLLEIKLQTSPTIDLGKVCPNSILNLGNLTLEGIPVRHCDVRYALFYGVISQKEIHITNFAITSGKNFFNRFPQFKGKIINKKIQLPLPKTFFEL